jgi:protein phosphatase 1 regulatory subunit 7
LGKNKIKKLENLNLPNLSILSVQSNRLSKIENLDSLPNLTELYLSDNGITKIEGLEKLTQLKVLDLASNKIERIENVEHLKNLEEFWFNNNYLSKWEDIDVLKHLTSLKCLYLEHNPIYYVNNMKPSSITAVIDNQTLNSSYRRKIILTLPNLEQLDATLCSKPSIAHPVKTN